MQLAGFIEELAGSASADRLFELVCRATLPLGYIYSGFFALTPEALQAVPSEDAPIVMSNYPEGILQLYVKEKLHLIDPILHLAKETITPLVWSEVIAQKTLSLEQNEMIGRRREAGLHDEITCPIHVSHGRAFALRVARADPGPCERSHLSILQVISIHFYYAFARLFDATGGTCTPRPGMGDNNQTCIVAQCLLSEREKQVLLWTARGKSASSISVILNLSENTVNFYVKNAMRKLGTTNRVVAVVLAVRSGLIKP